MAIVDKLPPLRSVHAFGAVARAGSVVSAADDLGVSPSALSHLIRQLERRLGVPLFSRAGRGLKLTADGEHLAAAVVPALAAIADAVHSFARRGTELRISTLSTFAVRWLIPRLSGFQARHPSIELFLSTSTRAVDLSTETFDCAIRFGSGAWQGLHCELLYREELVPACSPQWLAQGRLRTLQDLKRVKLLHARARRQDWSRWLLAQGATGIDTEAGPVFETRDLAIQAAIAQMGIAIVDPRFVEAELAAGQLVLPFTQRLSLGTGYWLVWRPGRESGRPLKAFCSWLMNEAAASMTAPITLLHAVTAQHYDAARELFEEYFAQLGVDLRFQNLAGELADLSVMYAAPAGCLVLAMRDGTAVGCGAVRRLKDGICEMKRLYIRPDARGAQLGRRLALALIGAARGLGYSAMRLDTLADMAAARRLYHSLGFREIPAYYANPLQNTLYMEIDLAGASATGG